MATNNTAEEVRQYRDVMGPDLGALFYNFWNESAWLHLKWSEYLILFGTKPERIELLNAAAPSFFRVIQDSLWEDVLLHICRMTDPPRSARKDNLSLQRLPDLVTPEIRPTVQTLVQALDRCEFARDWRNRHIAHRDLALALGQNATPLAAASRKSVKEALESIVSLLNCIELHYMKATTVYGMLPPLGNAEALLYVLRDGLEAEAARQRRLESGNLLPDDVNPQSAV